MAAVEEKEREGEGVEKREEEGRAEVMTKSLTEKDLEELRGCLDLGFAFSDEDVPELSSTLPALQLCFAMARQLHTASAGSMASWTICKPGDDPEEVKARLRLWAQAVACIARLCR